MKVTYLAWAIEKEDGTLWSTRGNAHLLRERELARILSGKHERPIRVRVTVEEVKR
jgi:hypothetical protein